MPKFLEELQLKSLSAVIAPRDDVSIYNSGGVLKVLHPDGTEQQLMTGESTGIDFSQYYTKVEIDELLAGQAGFSVEVVNELPNFGEAHIIYFVPNTDNSYDEYLFVNNRWEILGTTKVDLSAYAKSADVYAKTETYSKNEIDAKGYLTEHQDISNLATKSEVYTKEEVDDLIDNVDVSEELSNYYTKTETDNKIKTSIPSLTGYATQEWVENQKYIDSDTLDAKKYLTLTDIDNKVNREDLGTLAYKDSLTKADVGLSNVTNVASYSISEVDSKLSTIRSEITVADNAIRNTFVNYYDKAGVDKKIADAVSGGKVDLSNYYTKAEVDETISDIIGTAPEALDTIQEVAEAIRENQDAITAIENISSTKADKDSVYTKAEVDTAISKVTPNLANYATQSWVESKGYIDELALENKRYATKDELFLKVNTADLGKLAFEDTLSKASVGLGKVNNTSDMEKPISTATQTALDLKANLTDVITDYRSLSNLPTIPDSLSDLTNDMGFIGADGLSAYYTKTDIDDMLENRLTAGDLEDFYRKAEIDTKVANVKTELETEIDTKISDLIGTAPEALDTIQEIAAAVKENQDAVDAIESISASKQDKLVSGINIKTINGISILGSGNITIQGGSGGGSVDLSDYYTKGEIDDKLLNVDVDLTNYYTKDDTNALVELSKAAILDGVGENFDTLKEVAEWIADDEAGAAQMAIQIGNLTNDLQLKANTTDVYNKTEIDSMLENAGGSGGGSNVIPNPELDGGEEILESIQIEDTKYSLYGMDMTFSEVKTEDPDARVLRTLTIGNDEWKVDKGSVVNPNVELDGSEPMLESVMIDDVVFTVKGEEMIFSESAVEGSTPLRSIRLGNDVWGIPEGGGSGGSVDLTGYATESYVDTKVADLVNSAPGTLDTLGELATALQENQTVVEALDTAITNKLDSSKIVYSETEPTNPVLGMIWLKPAQ